MAARHVRLFTGAPSHRPQDTSLDGIERFARLSHDGNAPPFHRHDNPSKTRIQDRYAAPDTFAWQDQNSDGTFQARIKVS